MEDAFGDYDHAIAYAHCLACDNGRKGELHYLVQSDLGFVEHLGDNGHGSVNSFANAKSKMSGAAAHSAYNEPVA